MYALMVIGFIGGTQMQTFFLYDNPLQCNSAIQTTVHSLNKIGERVDSIGCTKVTGDDGLEFWRADAKGNLQQK